MSGCLAGGVYLSICGRFNIFPSNTKRPLLVLVQIYATVVSVLPLLPERDFETVFGVGKIRHKLREYCVRTVQAAALLLMPDEGCALPFSSIFPAAIFLRIARKTALRRSMSI